MSSPGGNHSLRRREIYKVLDEEETLLRPVNFHANGSGQGSLCSGLPQVPLCGGESPGVAYMVDHHRDPFAAIDEVLAGLDTPNILVDFHAEATAEKLSMGFYLDGRVSAVIGTHTHVQTADERILSGGAPPISPMPVCAAVLIRCWA